MQIAEKRRLKAQKYRGQSVRFIRIQKKAMHKLLIIYNFFTVLLAQMLVAPARINDIISNGKD